MNPKQIIVFLAALTASAQLVQAGNITGKVTLKGTAPAELNLPLDPLCKKTVKPNTTPTTRFYVTDDQGGLADVFVYLKNVDASTAPADPVVLDQKSCEYSPYVVGAQVGQTVKVLNSDPVLHNVHPTPKKAGKEYNKAQLPNGPALEFSWDKPEVFLRFKCDVHPWMFAYVGYVEHGYFAVTKEDGSFTIKDVPPGTYEIEAVHRKTHTKGEGIVAKVEVTDVAGQVNFVNFVVDITK